MAHRSACQSPRWAWERVTFAYSCVEDQHRQVKSRLWYSPRPSRQAHYVSFLVWQWPRDSAGLGRHCVARICSFCPSMPPRAPKRVAPCRSWSRGRDVGLQKVRHAFGRSRAVSARRPALVWVGPAWLKACMRQRFLSSPSAWPVAAEYRLRGGPVVDQASVGRGSRAPAAAAADVTSGVAKGVFVRICVEVEVSGGSWGLVDISRRFPGAVASSPQKLEAKLE